MTLRTARERILMTLAFETGGLAIVTPAYAVVFGKGAAMSLAVGLSMSLAVMVWAPFHNAIWDRAEWRATGRLASLRPGRLRLAHAVSHEVTAMVVTLPILMLLGGHGFGEAIMADLGLAAIYAVWAWVFYLVWDRLRPLPAVTRETAWRA